ncbi:MAG: hypothetical protein ACREKF_11285, partial [Candidatus Methylomirabilales bacterium]
GNNTFPDMSVAENLELSLAPHRPEGDRAEMLRFVYPEFEETRHMSGGQVRRIAELRGRVAQ